MVAWSPKRLAHAGGEHCERHAYRSGADGHTVAREDVAAGLGWSVTPGQTKPHEADRFCRSATARAGDAGDRDGTLRAGTRERAFGHGSRDRFADGAVGGD